MEDFANKKICHLLLKFRKGNRVVLLNVKHYMFTNALKPSLAHSELLVISDK